MSFPKIIVVSHRLVTLPTKEGEGAKLSKKGQKVLRKQAEAMAKDLRKERVIIFYSPQEFLGETANIFAGFFRQSSIERHPDFWGSMNGPYDKDRFMELFQERAGSSEASTIIFLTNRRGVVGFTKHLEKNGAMSFSHIAKNGVEIYTIKPQPQPVAYIRAKSATS